jgi:hypothetical protein
MERSWILLIRSIGFKKKMICILQFYRKYFQRQKLSWLPLASVFGNIFCEYMPEASSVFSSNY